MEPKRAVFVELRKDDRAAFEEGLALVAELKYAQAEERFSRVVGWYRATGDEARASETLFWQGYCREKLGQMGAARQTYQLLVALYPGTPAARQADERMRRLPMGPPPATQPAGRPDEPAPQGARPSGKADAATAGRALKGL